MSEKETKKLFKVRRIKYIKIPEVLEDSLTILERIAQSKYAVGDPLLMPTDTVLKRIGKPVCVEDWGYVNNDPFWQKTSGTWATAIYRACQFSRSRAAP